MYQPSRDPVKRIPILVTTLLAAEQGAPTLSKIDLPQLNSQEASIHVEVRYFVWDVAAPSQVEYTNTVCIRSNFYPCFVTTTIRR